MENFYQVLWLVAVAFIVWALYRYVKGHPELFSRENMSKSFSSMGILALLLMVFVAFLVYIVRNT